MTHKLTAAVWGFCALSAISASAQQAAQSNQQLETIVVTATRTAQPSYDLPIAIDSIDQSAIQDGQLQVNLSETLSRVPGIVVQNRQNYAQDLQISSRGFGQRATFGIRGMRIFVDGIPATQPDGQGQVSNIDLGSAKTIEVLRGPFSALYGNAAGGVISVFTEDGKRGIAFDTIAEYGSFGASRGAVKVSGEQDGINYVFDAADFTIGGNRDHSSAQRGNFNGKLRFTPDDASSLTLIANAVDVRANDPLGLTRAQYDANPLQAGTGALAFNTRKYLDQEQTGLSYERIFGDSDTLNAIVYGGNRSVTQYQAIPLSTQAPPSSPGGTIDLAEAYGGADIHFTDRRAIGDTTLTVTAGLAYDDLSEDRRGYLNYIGALQGVQGALRRNETDTVYDFDQYVQAQLEIGAHWLVEAGLRNSRVVISSVDHYIVPGNGNDSGGVTYGATTPVAGITYKITPSLNVYASYGRGFQTPTLDEIAYRSTNGSITGLNLGLKPSTSDNYEIGLKSFIGDNLKLNVTAFHIDTANELAIEANTAGRAVYQNVDSTTRDGVEVGADGKWSNGIGMVFAYTFLRAVYGTSFTACPGLPCIATIIPAGNRLPGVPLDSAYGEVSWSDASSGFSVALETRVESRVFVNDPNSDAAPFYAIANLRASLEQEFDRWRLKEFIRIDNLSDRKYAGSVIVNESNGRFFEPAPGRAVYAGISAHY
jgi:iron complex outermembrane receptor protein